MPEYRRTFIPGGTYFFTLVTYQRSPVFVNPDARQTLRAAWLAVQARLPFITIAVCLLPDHLHCIWKLPEKDCNYSLRWREIKRRFSKTYRLLTTETIARSPSRIRRDEAPFWQRRFWEHTICDQDDLNRHVEYIHYNPVKHGLVQAPGEWPYSSFHQYVRRGIYDDEWGEDFVSRIYDVE